MKQQFKPTQEQISAANAVFVAMAYADTLRPIIDKIHKNAIDLIMPKVDTEKWPKDDRNHLPNDEQEFITKWDHLYLATGEDARKCFKFAHKEVIKSGFDVKNDYCPLLIAEDLLSQAQRLLVDSMEPITKLKTDNIICSTGGMKNYKKMIDLALGLLAPFVKQTA